jgi:putative ABC transport system permease protein
VEEGDPRRSCSTSSAWAARELGLPITLTPASIAVAAALGIVTVAVAPLLSVRRLKNMDLPATLRVVE